VGCRDKEAIPNPLGQIETNAIEEMIANPSDEDVEKETDDVSWHHHVPIAFALTVQVDHNGRHNAIQSDELHQIEPV
jgi:hypothetical protein